MSLPTLRAVQDDGSVVAVREEDLYKYTRYRWVYNEAYNLSQRYLKFNLQELIRVAIEAVPKNCASHCVQVLKCKEGMNNKAYLLTMDGGFEVFAKLPCSSAGPPFYTTASEVATRTFLHEGLGIPNPRIYAWSACKDNPVGSEYIIEERAQGQPLGSIWQEWTKMPMQLRYGIAGQVVDLEAKLAEATFQHTGAIYFKKDFPEGTALAMTNPSTTSPEILERYVMGPLFDLDYGPNLDVAMNRGPFNNALEFVISKASNEMTFVTKYATPRMNYNRSSMEPEVTEEILELLGHYLQLSPAMIAQSRPEHGLNASTLWHPDLHLDNVFVDTTTMQISCLIDWQSAIAAPFLHQSRIPKIFHHPEPVSLDLANWPELPKDYAQLGKAEQEYATNMVRSGRLHTQYLRETKSKNPRHWAALEVNDEDRIQPVKIAQGIWKRNCTFYLRRAIIRIIQHWEILCPDAGTCPCSTEVLEREMALYELECESRKFVYSMLQLFENNHGLHPDGTIGLDRYEEVMKEIKSWKDFALKHADDDEERMAIQRTWPFRDTVDENGIETSES